MNGDDRDQDFLPSTHFVPSTRPPRVPPWSIHGWGTIPVRNVYPESPEPPTTPVGLPPSAQAQTLPTTPAAAPSAPPPPSYYLERRRNDLINELRYPHRAETTLGRVGQTLGRIGETVGTALFPGVAETIPGSRLAKRQELEKVTDMLGQQQAREAGLQESAARTEETKARTATMGHGKPGPIGMESYTTSPGGGEPIVKFPVEFPGQGEMEWRTPGTPGFLLPSTPQATGAPPETPGGMPRVGGLAAPPMAAPTPPPGWSPPVTTYGAPKPGAQQLTPQEIAQQNAENQAYYQSFNPGKPLPPEFMLQPGATKDDQARIFNGLKATESGAATQEQRRQTDELARQRELRATEEQHRRDEEAAGKLVRAVDQDNRVHYLSRGDYDANKDNFHEHPINLAPGELEKAQDHTTRINEMQGAMDLVAQAARNFNFDDFGQQSLVQLALSSTNDSFVDKTIGIPVVEWVAQNFKKWNLGTDTREYITALITLREALLAMPKEVTEGSRLMDASVRALYATLPGGATPDRAWAMHQLRNTQLILDRLRGTRVPIIDGMFVQPKVPELYQHMKRDPKTGREIFTDDGQHWVDEDGRPISGKR